MFPERTCPQKTTCGIQVAFASFPDVSVFLDVQYVLDWWTLELLENLFMSHQEFDFV